MRIFRHHPVRLARALVAVSIIAAAAGCSGSNSSNIPGGGNNGNICDFNAQSISLARTPGSGGNGNAIEIVSSTQSDDLHGNPNAYDLNIVLNNSLVTVTSPLTPVSDTGGPHPYTNDFYYSGTLQGSLQSGVTYSVYLNAPNSNCQPGFIGSFQY